MSQFCEYCEAASALSNGDVYCSKHMKDFERLETGIFYLNRNEIFSGEHFSRFALRFFLQGNANLKVDGTLFQINGPSLINFNLNSSYDLEIAKGPITTEQIGMAFRPSFLRSVQLYSANTDEFLLDHPDDTGQDLSIRSVQRPLYGAWKTIPYLLKSLLPAGDDMAAIEKERMQELALTILEHYFGELKLINTYHENLSTIKKLSTKEELLNRLLIARDFIETADVNQLTTMAVAKQAFLSEFHFIRCYRTVFGESPYQTILRRRFDMAYDLIRNTHKPISAVCYEVGYLDNSSFSRHFKQFFNIRPSDLRA